MHQVKYSDGKSRILPTNFVPDPSIHLMWHFVFEVGRVGDIVAPMYQWDRIRMIHDNGYPHDGRADKDPYPHDRRADKDSYPHDSNNQCTILRLQLSFAMINVQLMLV